MPRTPLSSRFQAQAGFRRGPIAAALKAELQRLLTDPHDPEGAVIREKFGNVIIDFVRQAFLQKSHNRADEGGVKWLETDAYRSGETDRMGYVTGNMFRSLKVEVTANGIRIYADPNMADYAKFFHGGTRHLPPRPLWPDPIPDRWISAAMRHVLPDIKRVLERRIRLQRAVPRLARAREMV